MKAKITAKRGYSGVDHMIDEVIHWAENRMSGIEYRDAGCAKRGAWAAIKWALKNKYANAAKSYGRMGITTASFSVD